MKNLDLKDIVPKDSEVALFKNGKKKKYKLRKVTLYDEAWMQQVYGKKLQEYFQTLEMNQLSKLLFRLLDDKSDFEAEDVDDYDDDGRRIAKTVTGPMKVLQSVVGKQHQIDVIYALLETMGVSRPIIENIEKGEAIKKKDPPRAQKSKTGEKSSKP